jgi:hypothetical protein
VLAEFAGIAAPHQKFCGREMAEMQPCAHRICAALPYSSFSGFGSSRSLTLLAAMRRRSSSMAA